MGVEDMMGLATAEAKQPEIRPEISELGHVSRSKVNRLASGVLNPAYQRKKPVR
jgi:hypothetical protein